MLKTNLGNCLMFRKSYSLKGKYLNKKIVLFETYFWLCILGRLSQTVKNVIHMSILVVYTMHITMYCNLHCIYQSTYTIPTYTRLDLTIWEFLYYNELILILC